MSPFSGPRRKLALASRPPRLGCEMLPTITPLQPRRPLLPMTSNPCWMVEIVKGECLDSTNDWVPCSEELCDAPSETNIKDTVREQGPFSGACKPNESSFPDGAWILCIPNEHGIMSYTQLRFTSPLSSGVAFHDYPRTRLEKDYCKKAARPASRPIMLDMTIRLTLPSVVLWACNSMIAC